MNAVNLLNLSSLPLGFWLPKEASTVAKDVDGLFIGITVVTVVFCVLIFLLLVAFSVKYRHNKNRPTSESHAAGHSTALELTWTIIPTLITLVIFFYGFRGYLNMQVVPPNAYEIQVQSRTWSWSFQYPNGYVSPILVVPKDRPIKLVLSSDDVIHSFYAPVFRTQKMAVPGRYNRAWFQATELTPSDDRGFPVEGKGFDVFCAMYCGTNHAEMITQAYVLDPKVFPKWLEFASDLEKQPEYATKGPAWAGQKLYTQLGCNSCHSVDGSRIIGPSFKDLFGSQQPIKVSGSVLADENYIHDSILYPSKQVVEGYDNVMPPYQGRVTDKQVGWIIAYMKSISSAYKGGDPNAPAAGSQPSTNQAADRPPMTGQTTTRQVSEGQAATRPDEAKK